MALLHYHRGHFAKPEVDEFRLGIQKAKEAINNAIGSRQFSFDRLLANSRQTRRISRSFSPSKTIPSKQQERNLSISIPRRMLPSSNGRKSSYSGNFMKTNSTSRSFLSMKVVCLLKRITLILQSILRLSILVSSQ